MIFRAPAARLVATVVAGGPPGGPPPGSVAWTAAAAPLPTPWPAKDAALLGLRWLLAGGGDDHERGGGGGGGAPEPREVAAVYRGRGVPPGGAAAGAGLPPRLQHVGAPPASFEGRLWRYADGLGLAFVWLPGGNVAESMCEYEPVPPCHVA